jgi:hypothetical protein
MCVCVYIYTRQQYKGADPPTLLICFSHPPPPLSRLLPLILTTSVSAFLIPPIPCTATP